jgi:hypothetical protein
MHHRPVLVDDSVPHNFKRKPSKLQKRSETGKPVFNGIVSGSRQRDASSADAALGKSEDLHLDRSAPAMPPASSTLPLNRVHGLKHLARMRQRSKSEVSRPRNQKQRSRTLSRASESTSPCPLIPDTIPFPSRAGMDTVPSCSKARTPPLEKAYSPLAVRRSGSLRTTSSKLSEKTGLVRKHVRIIAFLDSVGHVFPTTTRPSRLQSEFEKVTEPGYERSQIAIELDMDFACPGEGHLDRSYAGNRRAWKVYIP